MGSTSLRCLPLLLYIGANLSGQQAPAPAPAVDAAAVQQLLAPVPEVVLCAAREGAPVAEFGLGDGGVSRQAGSLRVTDVGCVTPGAVEIQALAVGVKLTFPSGRELLMAPDGVLHLRSGEMGGPFAGGAELRLADGSLVRIALSPTSSQRLREVTVIHGEQALQLWCRGEAVFRLARPGGWPGVHLSCCGDGGDLYRTIALGPMLVLERVLVAKERERTAPRERLVVLTAPLLQSLALMPRQHRETALPVRQAVAAVAAVADHGNQVFAAGASLQRVERDRLRWRLAGGFELQLELEGQLAPRLQLFTGRSTVAMVEWTLRADSAAFMANPIQGQPDRRWHGNGTRLGKIVVDLQANDELFERAHALTVIGRLGKTPR